MSVAAGVGLHEGTRQTAEGSAVNSSWARRSRAFPRMIVADKPPRALRPRTTSPPLYRARSRAIASPKPEPGWASSSRWPTAKACSHCSGAIPLPSSSMRMDAVVPCALPADGALRCRPFPGIVDQVGHDFGQVERVAGDGQVGRVDEVEGDPALAVDASHRAQRPARPSAHRRAVAGCPRRACASRAGEVIVDLTRHSLDFAKEYRRGTRCPAA